ncbi:MAG: hypothetical protein JWR89_2936 [Tardiphaga sp.]|nr:hypothetical protein [Tardiphaga sp.]
MTMHIVLAAHLLGLGIAVATIVSLVPAVTQLLRMVV